MALSAVSLLLLAACAEGENLDENTGGGDVASSSSSAIGVTSSSGVGVTSSSSSGTSSAVSTTSSSTTAATSSSSGAGGDAASTSVSSSTGVGGEGGAGGIGGAGGAGGDGGAGVTSTTASTSVSSTTSTSVSSTASTSVSSTTSASTGGGGSATSTTTSASTGGGPTGELEVQYAVRVSTAMTQGLSFTVRVRNTGDEPIALSDVTIRYWFTADGASSAFVGACDFTEIPGGCDGITRTFGDASGTEADRYLELGFSSAAGNLAPGATSGQAQIRIHSATYESMEQTNDYSFDATLTALTPWEQMTAYHDGVLAWGTEP